jgi:hypothetical protein
MFVAMEGEAPAEPCSHSVFQLGGSLALRVMRSLE